VEGERSIDDGGSDAVCGCGEMDDVDPVAADDPSQLLCRLTVCVERPRAVGLTVGLLVVGAYDEETAAVDDDIVIDASKKRG